MGSTLYTTTSEETARFVKSDADMAVTQTEADAESRTLWREWPRVDAAEAKALVDTMMGTAQVTDPQVDKETYTGLYSVADVVVIENNRRWVTIRQKLIRITTILSVADLPQPVDAARRELYRPFQYDPGYGDIRIFEYKFLDRSSREVCMEGGDDSVIPDGQLEQSGYTLEGRRWVTEERGDRTCTFFTFQRKVTWENINDDGDDVDTVRQMGESGYHAGQAYLGYLQKQEQVAFGVPLDDASSVVDKWHTTGTPGTDGWATSDVTLIMKPDGEAYISRTREPSNSTTALASGILLEREMYAALGLPKRAVIILPNLTKSNADSVLSTLKSQTTITIDGTTYRNAGVRRNIHSSGLADLIITGKILGIAPTNANNYAVGDTVIFAQEIIIADDGETRYRHTVGRRITESESAAVDWANQSDEKPFQNNLGTHKGGKVNKLTNLGLYEALKETWTSSNEFSTTP